MSIDINLDDCDNFSLFSQLSDLDDFLRDEPEAPLEPTPDCGSQSRLRSDDLLLAQCEHVDDLRRRSDGILDMCCPEVNGDHSVVDMASAVETGFAAFSASSSHSVVGGCVPPTFEGDSPMVTDQCSDDERTVVETTARRFRLVGNVFHLTYRGNTILIHLFYFCLITELKWYYRAS